MRATPIAAALGVLLAVSLALPGCEQSTAAPSPLEPRATLQDIMKGVVEPAAEQVWEAVSTEVTKDGIREKAPATDGEWQAVRQRAQALAEAANLLVVADRPVAAPGKVLEDAGTPGILTAAEIEKAVAADRIGFVQRAHVLHRAASQALAAIDARNPAALVEAGSRIEDACEHCHSRYWYPQAVQPKLVFDAKAPAAAAAR